MKNKFLALGCLIAAIVLGISSSTVTARFFYSFSEGDAWGYVMAIIGLSLDFGKFAFPALSVFQFNRDKFISSIIFGLLSVLCVGTSFFASMAFDLNKANEISNETITSSGAYQRQQELFKTTTSSIESLKNDIASLKASREKDEQKIRADYAPLIANARKLNMLTINKDSVAEITKRMEAKISSLDSTIAEKQTQLAKKESELAGINQGFQSVGTNIKTTKGAYALSEWINPKDPAGTLGILNMIKDLLLEIVAIAFSIGFGILIGKDENITLESARTVDKSTYSDNNPNPPSPDDKPRFRLKTKAKSENNTTNPKIININKPLSSPISGVKDMEYHKYIDYMYKNQKNQISPGYIKISKDTGISLKKCRLINGYLEQNNIIRKENKKSIILRPKDSIA